MLRLREESCAYPRRSKSSFAIRPLHKLNVGVQV
jgi:hypothetical protein